MESCRGRGCGVGGGGRERGGAPGGAEGRRRRAGIRTRRKLHKLGAGRRSLSHTHMQFQCPWAEKSSAPSRTQLPQARSWQTTISHKITGPRTRTPHPHPSPAPASAPLTRTATHLCHAEGQVVPLRRLLGGAKALAELLHQRIALLVLLDVTQQLRLGRGRRGAQAACERAPGMGVRQKLELQRADETCRAPRMAAAQRDVPRCMRGRPICPRPAQPAGVRVACSRRMQANCLGHRIAHAWRLSQQAAGLGERGRKLPQDKKMHTCTRMTPHAPAPTARPPEARRPSSQRAPAA